MSKLGVPHNNSLTVAPVRGMYTCLGPSLATRLRMTRRWNAHLPRKFSNGWLHTSHQETTTAPPTVPPPPAQKRRRRRHGQASATLDRCAQIKPLTKWHVRKQTRPHCGYGNSDGDLLYDNSEIDFAMTESYTGMKEGFFSGFFSGSFLVRLVWCDDRLYGAVSRATLLE